MAGGEEEAQTCELFPQSCSAGGEGREAWMLWPVVAGVEYEELGGKRGETADIRMKGSPCQRIPYWEQPGGMCCSHNASPHSQRPIKPQGLNRSSSRGQARKQFHAVQAVCQGLDSPIYGGAPTYFTPYLIPGIAINMLLMQTARLNPFQHTHSCTRR